jgi:hypothetical protein
MSNIFNNKHYESNDGMMTSIWGGPLWFSLHCISFNYPINPTKEQKIYHKNFFENLAHILPCKACRTNYQENIKHLPLTSKVLKTRSSFSKWLYDIHELVNKKLNKNSSLTYEQVRDRYEQFRSRCLQNSDIKEKNSEIGCIEPLRGIKSKCVINIIPKILKTESFKIDKRCILSK